MEVPFDVGAPEELIVIEKRLRQAALRSVNVPSKVVHREVGWQNEGDVLGIHDDFV